MTMQFFFAHGGADAPVEKSLAHLIFGRWYVALGLLVLVVLIVIRLTMLISRGSKAVTYSAVLTTLFITGVGTYTLSTVVSVLSIGLGFAMALIQVLTSLSGTPTEIKEEKK